MPTKKPTKRKSPKALELEKKQKLLDEFKQKAEKEIKRYSARVYCTKRKAKKI